MQHPQSLRSGHQPRSQVHSRNRLDPGYGQQREVQPEAHGAHACATRPLLQLYTAPDEAEAWRLAAGLPTSVEAGTTRFDSYLLAIEAASEGQGIAVVPSFLVAADLRSGRLVTPFDVSIPQPRRWYLVCRAGQQHLPHVSAFADWLQAEVHGDQ